MQGCSGCLLIISFLNSCLLKKRVIRSGVLLPMLCFETAFKKQVLCFGFLVIESVLFIISLPQPISTRLNSFKTDMERICIHHYSSVTGDSPSVTSDEAIYTYHNSSITSDQSFCTE